MNCLFASDDQNTEDSALASVLPVNIQGCSPLRLTSLVSLLSRGLLGVFSSTTVQRRQFFGLLPSLWSSSHNRVPTNLVFYAWQCRYVNAALSVLPTLPFPHCVPKSNLYIYVCILALQIFKLDSSKDWETRLYCVFKKQTQNTKMLCIK